MRRILLSLLLLSATACCPGRRLATSSRDSVRIEVRTHTEYLRDTVYHQVPMQSERVTVCDTTSHLENLYAASDARINPDGTLSHSLATKPHRWPVAFEKPVEHRDSIVYRDRAATEVVEVPRSLTPWQKCRLWGFWVLLAVVAVLLRKQVAALVKWAI